MDKCPDVRKRLEQRVSILTKWRNIGLTIGIIGMILGVIGVTSFFLESTQQPFTGTFNPVIDGVWNENENWDKHIGSSWMYAEYIIPDYDHMATTNYIYCHLDLDSGLLYFLVDLVSDGTNDTEHEFFNWFYNGNDTFYDVFNSDLSWNNRLIDPDYSSEMFCYIPETDTFNLTFDYYTYSLNTSLDESDVDIAFGFQNTTNGMFPHRIFEFSIEIDALRYFNDGEKFDFAILGYGTLSSYYATGLYSAPSDFGFLLWDSGKIDEYLYYRCGTNIKGDLWNTPNEFDIQEGFPI